MERIISDSPLKVFISSTMMDLQLERRAVKETIEQLNFVAVLAETEGAHTDTPKQATLSWVKQSDIYIGLFWQRYGFVGSSGSSATEEEYQVARAKKMPILIYIKEPSPNRDKLLTRFLQELSQYEDGNLRAVFTTIEELKGYIKRDLSKAISKLARGELVTQIEKNYRADAEATPADLRELEGVLGLLRSRVLKRVKEQLDPSAKRFKLMDSVEEGCKNLALKISSDGYIPDLILGWRNLESQYKGSEIVARILSDYMHVPFRIVEVKEVGEKRQVVGKYDWLDGVRQLLIIDDACYSGSTLKMLRETIISTSPSVEVRFAVLSTLHPNQLENLYYIATHNTEELLFPWGWSRLIVGFYDIYKLFGISDRRVVTHEDFSWGMVENIAANFIGSVRLIAIKAGEEMRIESGQIKDNFLFFMTGQAEVIIDDMTGTYNAGEYIFIPRGVGFIVKSINDLQILELISDTKGM